MVWSVLLLTPLQFSSSTEQRFPFQEGQPVCYFQSSQNTTAPESLVFTLTARLQIVPALSVAGLLGGRNEGGLPRVAVHLEAVIVARDALAPSPIRLKSTPGSPHTPILRVASGVGAVEAGSSDRCQPEVVLPFHARLLEFLLREGDTLCPTVVWLRHTDGGHRTILIILALDR